jgi:hypothetical protein
LLAICGAIIHRLEESKPMKALTLAAAFALALPGFALAQTGTHAPPAQEQKNPGRAPAVSPGHEMQDARSARKTVTHGASDFSPGDKMNDKRGK